MQLRTRRDPQRGNSLVLALVILSALGTLATLTTASIKGAIQTAGTDKFHTIAVYAAESGGAAAMDYLRGVVDTQTGFTALLQTGATSPDAIAGNNRLPGQAGNPFSSDLSAYYRVEIDNNRNDTGYATQTDTDHRVVIRATGYGPDGATAIIEWDVQSAGGRVRRPCPVYAQKGESEDNAGRNDCLGTIDTSQSAEFSP
jgi:hypothetical protein